MTDWLLLAKGAAQALPGVKANLTEFAAALRHRAEERGGPDAVNAADLLLAFAALRHDPVAAKELDRRLVRAVRAVAGRFSGVNADELVQRARHRVFAGEGAGGPRLAKYTGRGAIVAWLSAVATSLAVDETRAQSRERRASEDEVVATESSDAGPEAKLLRAEHKHHFNAAFKQALGTLSAQERTLMRMKFVDGLAVEDIGKAFAVHRTTAMRWLEKAQAQVMEATRAELSARLKMRGRELDSLVRVLQPSINDRLSRLLAAVGPKS